MTHDHATVGLDIATYLHAQGVTQEITAVQEPGPIPAVFLGPMADKPDRAMAIIGPWQDNSYAEHSAVIRFMVSVRSEPWDDTGLATDCQRLFTALQQHSEFPLTAAQDVMWCERIVSDPPMQDQNRRWVRVDTYSARLQPPTT